MKMTIPYLRLQASRSVLSPLPRHFLPVFRDSPDSPDFSRHFQPPLSLPLFACKNIMFTFSKKFIKIHFNLILRSAINFTVDNDLLLA